MKIFVDGVEGVSYSNSVNYQANGPVAISTQFNNSSSTNIIGDLDEFRVVKGVAVWTSDFTPPTTPYDCPNESSSESSTSEGFSESSSSTSEGYSESSSSSSVDGSLIARYNFEEGTGSTVSDAVGNNDGTTSGGFAWVEGKCGNYAGSFNGTDSFVEINDSNDFTNTGFSMSAWIKPNDISVNYQSVFSHYSDGTGADQSWLFVVRGPEDTVSFTVYDSSENFIGRTAPTSSLTLGEWSHIAATWDGTNSSGGIKVYVDGVQVDDTNLEFGSFGGINNSAEQVRVGAARNNGSNAYFFDGSIDDVRYYNKELSVSEINEVKNNCPDLVSSSSSIDSSSSSSSEGNSESSSSSEGISSESSSSSPEDNILAKYTFEEGSGATLEDTSGNNRDGTVSGMTWEAGRCGTYSGSFNGTSDNVSITDSDVLGLVNTSRATITAWVKRDSTGNKDHIFNKYNGLVGEYSFALSLRDDDVFEAVFYDNGGVTDRVGQRSIATINSGQWYHLAATLSGTTVKLYIDGSLASSTSINNGSFVSIDGSSEPVRVGVIRNSSEWLYFDGSIDDLRVYDRDLSEQEIADVMNECEELNSESSSSSSTSSEEYSESSSSSEGYSESSSSSEDYSESSSSSSEGFTSESSFGDDMLAKYLFTEGSGTTVQDSSGNGRDGTVVGSMGWAEGRCGLYSGSFDGSSDYVDLPSIGIDNTNDTFSLCCWVKLNSVGANQTLIANSSANVADSGKASVWLIAKTTGELAFWINESQVATIRLESTQTLTTGVWYFIAATYDGSRNINGLEIYIDGSSAPNTPIGTTVPVGNSVDDWVLGATGGNFKGNFLLDGFLDDVRIYDRVLTLSEINEVMNDCGDLVSSSSSEGNSESSSSSSSN
jgi:hypothetical protein